MQTNPESPMPNAGMPPDTVDAAKPLSSAPGVPRQRGIVLLVLYLIVTCVLSMIAARLYFAVPVMAEAFRTFGTELPNLTVLVMAWVPYLGLVALFSAALTFDVWRRKTCSDSYRSFVTGLLVVLIIFTLAIGPIVDWAMYLPIALLGKVV